MIITLSDPKALGRYEVSITTTSPKEEAVGPLGSGEIGLVLLSIAQGLLAKSVTEHRRCPKAPVLAIASPAEVEAIQKTTG